MLQLPFPWYLSQTTTWTPTSPHFPLLHLCPNKPFILQQATVGEVYLHSPLTAVSSYLAACPPKSPQISSVYRSIYWTSDFLTHFFLFNWQHFGDILYEQLIHTTTTNCYCGGKVWGFRCCLFWVWNKKLHWKKLHSVQIKVTSSCSTTEWATAA